MDNTRVFTAPSRVGVWWSSDRRPIHEVQAACAELEALGYGSLWFPESSGKEALTQAGAFLSATTTLRVGTGIANIHARDPLAAEVGSRTLAALHPHRFVLGLGVSHAPLVERRQGSYDRPLATMRTYLRLMDEVPEQVEPLPERPLRVLAALGPAMLALAREMTDGAHPYLVPPEHTVLARAALGPDKALVVEQGVVLSDDPVLRRARVSAHLEAYSALPNYRNSWLRLGFDEDDLAGGVSERLRNALVASGDPAAIRSRVEQHLAAGADHVCIQVLGDSRGSDPMPDLRRLADALVDL